MYIFLWKYFFLKLCLLKIELRMKLLCSCQITRCERPAFVLFCCAPPWRKMGQNLKMCIFLINSSHECGNFLVQCSKGIHMGDFCEIFKSGTQIFNSFCPLSRHFVAILFSFHVCRTFDHEQKAFTLSINPINID